MPNKTNNDFIPFSQTLVADCLDALRLHVGSSRGIKGKGLYANGERRIGQIFSKTRQGKMLTHQNIAEMTRYLESLGAIPPESLRSVSQSHHFYDKIIQVEPIGEQVEMYDIEVEDMHSFVAEGFICHNSQGSEYPVVVLAVHTQHFMLLQRNLLYTALTRAKKFAVLVGSQRAIAMAVKKQSDTKRHTRLKERLQGTLGC